MTFSRFSSRYGAKLHGDHVKNEFRSAFFRIFLSTSGAKLRTWRSCPRRVQECIFHVLCTMSGAKLHGDRVKNKVRSAVLRVCSSRSGAKLHGDRIKNEFRSAVFSRFSEQVWGKVKLRSCTKRVQECISRVFSIKSAAKLHGDRVINQFRKAVFRVCFAFFQAGLGQSCLKIVPKTCSGVYFSCLLKHV